MSGLGISLSHLSLSYKVHKAQLMAFSIEQARFEPGEITALIGPSGCGKSSLIHSLTGLFYNSSKKIELKGSIFFDKEELTGLRSDTAVIFQDYGLLPWKTVRENIELPLKLRHVKIHDRQAKCNQLLKELSLNDFANFYPDKLSGGMKQRTALARALIAQPKVLLMDEPFSALDALNRENAQSLLLRLWIKHKMTTIIVTHSIEEAVYLGHKVIVFSGNQPGRISHILKIQKSDDLKSFRQSELFFQQVNALRLYLNQNLEQDSLE